MREKIDSLVDRLVELPVMISDLQFKALSINNEIKKISERITTRESEIKSEINSATDDNGKKLYSNEESRKIAFLSDCQEDSTLLSLYDERTSQNNQLEEVRILIELYSNEQRNTRSIMSILNIVPDL